MWLDVPQKHYSPDVSTEARKVVSDLTRSYRKGEISEDTYERLVGMVFAARIQQELEETSRSTFRLSDNLFRLFKGVWA